MYKYIFTVRMFGIIVDREQILPQNIFINYISTISMESFLES